MNLEIFSKNKTSPIGATASVLNDTGMFCLVGGSDGDSDSSDSQYLKVRCLDIENAIWKPSFVDTNYIKNRSFHASTVLQDKIYLFGGCVATYEDGMSIAPSEEIVKIESVRFGMAASVQLSSEFTARQGLTANTVGPEKARAVLFGGCSTESTNFSSDVFMFVPDAVTEEGNEMLKLVDVDPAILPPARAYHSSAISGHMNQYLIIYGGIDQSKAPLNDVWVLDLTLVLLPPEPPAPVDPKAKKGKEEPVIPMAKWTQIVIEEPAYPPSYMHSCFVMDNTDSLELYILGGISTPGALPFEGLRQISISKGEGGVFSIGQEIRVPSRTEGAEESKGYDPTDSLTCYGSVVAPVSDTLFMTIPPSPEGEQPIPPSPPVFVMVFGGNKQRQLQPPSPDENNAYMIVFDQKNELVKRVRRAIRRNLGLPPISTNIPSEGFIKIIQFPNGDRYEGQVKRLTEPEVDEDGLEVVVEEDTNTNHLRYTPHQVGTMSYSASQEMYEGAWVDGLKHGFGTYTIPPTDSTGISTYKGMFDQDRKNGKGELTVDGAFCYKGVFMDDVYDGSGELTSLVSGDVHTGSFSNNMKEGAGVLITGQDKSETTGTWKEDKIVGYGYAKGLSIRCVNTTVAAIIEPLPTVIEGGGLVQPMVTSHEAVGEDCSTIKGRYTGPLESGIPFGEDGVCAYSDGSEYTGQWKSGKRNGNGTFIFPSNDLFIGKWVADKRCGHGTLTSALLSDYEGIWEDDKPHGAGTMTNKDGTVYTGDFNAGRKQGVGKLTGPEPDQIIFEGPWSQDDPIFPPKTGSVTGGGSVRSNTSTSVF